MEKNKCENCVHCKPFYDVNTVCFIGHPMLYKSVKKTDSCDKFKKK